MQHLDLPLMAVLQKKLSLIEWRSKVEDTAARIARGEQRTSLLQIHTVLEEGCDKSFLDKEGFFGPNMQATGYMLSEHVLSYQPLKELKLDAALDSMSASPLKDNNATMDDEEDNDRVRQAKGMFTPLLSRFNCL